ncbi:MAG: TatD family hydrolase [Spirochaetaceae bacterium]|jgi:TatD DNase family protein|nr:TatD family hydrolase [Spirochaetaceae bacterium]
MPADAHCHLLDLAKRFPEAEARRWKLGIVCGASAWNAEDFSYQADLKRTAGLNGGPRIFCCFGVHPQLPACAEPAQVSAGLALLETLAGQGQLDGIGETGFDLFDQSFRDTEAVQDRLFSAHLDAALRLGLPLILHVRKALHKVFAHAKTLKKLRSVIFHSYPGTLAEGEAFLRRGINAYFSFGNPLIRGRKASVSACAGLPADRILAETDAPYQPLPGAAFSQWDDLLAVSRTIAHIRTAPEFAHSARNFLSRNPENSFFQKNDQEETLLEKKREKLEKKREKEEKQEEELAKEEEKLAEENFYRAYLC